MPLPPLGAHISIAGGFAKAAKLAAAELGATAVQIFLKSPRSHTTTRLDAAAAADYRAAAAAAGVTFTVVHCSYLLNFGKQLALTDWPCTNLLDDLRGAASMGAAGVVLHVGKALELPRTEALQFVAQNIRQILAATAELPVRILLENTAGQGTELGYTFAELAEIFDALGRPARVGFCLDTAHAWAAGYDLATENGVAALLTEFDQKLGLGNLACLHFNDAKVARGSRVDRHANLDCGQIGPVGLSAVARQAAAHGWPLILETPEVSGGSHVADLQILREWLAAEV